MKRVLDKLRNKMKVKPKETAAGSALPPQKPSPTERRVTRRHPANVPAKMEYGFAGMSEPSQIKDINERGLFLYSVLPLAHRSTIEVELILPPELAEPGKRRVRYTATVLRVEEKAGGELFGVAAAIKRCQVLADEPARQETQKAAAKAAKLSR
jgi:hypothetical protein